jgi:alpha-beta hydrolase superfamily lysophospholipase
MFYVDTSIVLLPPKLLFPSSAPILDVAVIVYRHHGTGHCLVVTMYIPPLTSLHERRHMIWVNSRNSYCFHGPLVENILNAGFVLYMVDSPGHGINQRLGPIQKDANASYDLEFRPGLDFVRDYVIGHHVPIRAIGDRVGATLLLRYQQDHHFFESLCLFSPLLDVRNATCRQNIYQRILAACVGWQVEQPRWSLVWYQTHGYRMDTRYHPHSHSTNDVDWFRDVLLGYSIHHRANIVCPVFVILGDRESNVYIARAKQLFHQSCEDLHLVYLRSCERWGVVVHTDLKDHESFQKFLELRPPCCP